MQQTYTSHPCNIQIALFIAFTLLLSMLPNQTFAETCQIANLEAQTLDVTIPCTEIGNAYVGLKFAYADDLSWKLADFFATDCTPNANCAKRDVNKNMTIPVRIDNAEYVAQLNYVSTNTDGLHWQYVKHYTNDLTFEPISVPVSDAEKRQIRTTPAINLNGKKYPIEFRTILRSGTRLNDHVYGQLIDHEGNPLKGRISNDNDFASLLPVGDKLFMVSHFESRPAAMYLTELKQDKQTGVLTAVNTQPIDFSKIRGGWVHCAGSVTPWNSHLGSEEYEPDAKLRDPGTGEIDDYYRPMADYYGGNLLALNPYDYGFPIEIKVLNEAGNYMVEKHYAMGRISYELAYVLPDKKTVYSSDDGTNVGLYLFIADQAMNLNSGTLYVMKWEQTGTDNGGKADLQWISLGHATSDEVRSLLDKRTAFDDIFVAAKPVDTSCPADFTSINTSRGHECLQLKPGMELAASRLETRRYAAMLGATTELRKEEGITYDPGHNTLFVALSEISHGMEDKSKKGYDVGGPNHIALPPNSCGGVYALDLAHNKEVGSDYVAKNMYAIIVGKPTTYEESSPYAQNTCDVDKLSNPDNITFIPGHRTLIIGEDTDGHQNDAIWAYHLDNHSLTRIFTTPYGSETTSPYIYRNINGFGYLMAVVQHPYGETDTDQLQVPEEALAYTGYIGPLPALE